MYFNAVNTGAKETKPYLPQKRGMQGISTIGCSAEKMSVRPGMKSSNCRYSDNLNRPLLCLPDSDYGENLGLWQNSNATPYSACICVPESSISPILNTLPKLVMVPPNSRRPDVGGKSSSTFSRSPLLKLLLAV
jgi:hypothetical protein